MTIASARKSFARRAISSASNGSRKRWIAGALSEIGLPEHAIPLALLFFNLGVEAGQLIFIAAVGLTWMLMRRVNWPEWAWKIPTYSIGALAGFWTIERIAGF